MSELIALFIGAFIGFMIGYNAKKEKLEKQRPAAPRQEKPRTFMDWQKKKVTYESDADRIRELNLLSTHEGKFLRILQHEFINNDVVVKNKRFFIVDADKYPIAIFEYRDGREGLKATDKEDGLPLFLYKGILSSDAVKEDAAFIKQQR